MADFDRESMMEMFSFEMSQLVEQLEQTIIQAESGYTMGQINEIFRIMHTIKGSSAMMMFDNIATTAHAIEDLFYYLREENPQGLDYSRLTDFVLEGMDFIKSEFEKIERAETADGDGTHIISRIKNYLKEIKGETVVNPITSTSQTNEISHISSTSDNENRYKSKIFFEEGCEMENIRAYTLIKNLGDLIFNTSHIPEDIIDENSIEEIRKNGFIIKFNTKLEYKQIEEELLKTIYLKDLYLEIDDSAKYPNISKNNNLFHYKAILTFAEDSEMENVRAYGVVHNISDKVENITHFPLDIINEDSIDFIKKNGFTIEFDTSMETDLVEDILSSTIYLKDLKIDKVSPTNENNSISNESSQDNTTETKDLKNIGASNGTPTNVSTNTTPKKPVSQHVISVNVSKLDQLLNLMGELVITEAMVTQNPEIEALELESFHKEAIQLRKIINDVQDTVMSMRMVPLSTTFFKMHRIVRDMCKQLNKDVSLEVLGEETEVDKNIIEHIADPLMHIIRNSIDHGIEMPDARHSKGKPEKGTVKLEAKNSGGDVLIIIKDDGAGLNKSRILEKAKNNGLLRKDENDYTDKEIHQFIFLPGFSTNDSVTSFSGRGVGMDVVSTNLEVVGGSVLVDSIPGEGSTFTLKIPLTLAIIEGMTIKMGNAKYTIPIISIQQSFKASKEHLFIDPSGNEMIRVRGEIYNLVRLYDFFDVDTDVKNIEDGITIMLENGEQTICIFADELIGEQQVVVKTMPKYIKKIRGISGCTLLGNGDISLIVDVVGFF